MLAHSIIDLIGKTPMLLIPEEVHGIKNLELWAKLEHLNPFGSLKDRTAWGLLRQDIKELQAKGKTIIEASSGNTGKSLQGIAGIFGLSTKIMSSLYKVSEQREILQLLGGELEEVEAASDCFDADDPDDPYYLIKELVESEPEKYFRAGQFDRAENSQVHFETTGKEIGADLGHVDTLFLGLGSTGSSLGIKRALAEINPAISCVGIANAKGDSIPGIMSIKELESAAAASMLFQTRAYEEIVEVRETEAIDEMLTLNRQVGLLCGPSTGANLHAVKRHYGSMGHPSEKTVAVFIACDRVEPYLSYIKERRPEIFDKRAKKTGIASFRLDGDVQRWAIDPDTMDDFVEEHKAIVIDIRSPKAHKLSPVKDAINIPLSLFEPLLDSGKPFPTDRPILLVCAIGEKTLRYAAFLREHGYDAYSLDKGVRGLIAAQSGFFSRGAFDESRRLSPTE